MLRRCSSSLSESVVTILEYIIEIADIDNDESFPNTFDCVEDPPKLGQLLQQSPGLSRMTGPTGETLLHAACRYGNIEAIKVLVAHGCDINAQNIRRSTPLQISIESHNHDCAHLLIDYGCDCHLLDNRGISALMNALNSARLTPDSLLLRLLAQGVPRKNHADFLPFHDITRSRSGDDRTHILFRMLIDAGWHCRIDSLDAMGRTALHYAIIYRQRMMIRLLTDAGARTNSTNNDGHNVLHEAGYWADTGIIQALRDAGIYNLDIRTPDQYGHTPLQVFWFQHIGESHPSPYWRRPGVDEMSAFGSLLRNVRDRAINIELQKLRNIIAMIKEDNISEAQEELCSLSQAKDDAKIVWEAETFRAINLQIKQLMLGPAIESLEEFMEVSQERLKISPFDEPAVDPWRFNYHRCLRNCPHKYKSDSESDCSNSEDEDSSSENEDSRSPRDEASNSVIDSGNVDEED